VQTAAMRPSAVFNIPSGSAAQQNAIAHHVNQLTAGAPRGALIRIAVFKFTSQAFARTLIDAKRRGARVQLVVDASTRDNDAYRRVERALGTSRKRSSWVVACHKGCIGDTIMHNKFFLFSRTGRARNVVVQSSANLTTRNRVNAWNNAFTISDARLYQAYGRYFAALAARHHERDHYRVTRSGRVTAYTFPRQGGSPGTDTLYRLLGGVDCARGTSVHVTTFNLSRTAVAQRLWSLSNQGCDVRVIYTNLSARAREILEQDGGPQLLNSHYLYFDPQTGDEVDAFAHSKYVLIDGTYAGRSRKVVITGSPNYTEPALRHNDETMLTIEGADIYGAYESNFARLWQTVQSHFQLQGIVPDPG
jgi:phosphatidylserine/phosphatidylglycerophosphate/cardiolipin synthase-like enzyme